MRHIHSALVATLLSVAGAAGSQAENVELGESFELGVGQSAQLESESLRIGFEGVSSDSRCPKGERCIWEGDATVKIWMQKASGPRETLELHTAERERKDESYGGYGVRLLRLDPYPISGKTVEREAYRATFEVTRESSSPVRER